MSRFQAQTNAVLDRELIEVQDRMGLEPSQKADLLREMSAITSWVLRQVHAGREVVAEGPDGREVFWHPAFDTHRSRPLSIALPEDEVMALGQILAEPPPAAWVATAKRALDADREPPPVRWKS